MDDLKKAWLQHPCTLDLMRRVRKESDQRNEMLRAKVRDPRASLDGIRAFEASISVLEALLKDITHVEKTP